MASTTRGRWFLDEYARRNRNSDTTAVLAAIARLEAALSERGQRDAARPSGQRMRLELTDLVQASAQARTEAAEPADAGSPPDIAAAAERLRQVVWTLRACAIDLPAAEQLAGIADLILTAEAHLQDSERRKRRLAAALAELELRAARLLESVDEAEAAPGDGLADRVESAAAPVPRPHESDPAPSKPAPAVEPATAVFATASGDDPTAFAVALVGPDHRNGPVPEPLVPEPLAGVASDMPAMPPVQNDTGTSALIAPAASAGAATTPSLPEPSAPEPVAPSPHKPEAAIAQRPSEPTTMRAPHDAAAINTDDGIPVWANAASTEPNESSAGLDDPAAFLLEEIPVTVPRALDPTVSTADNEATSEPTFADQHDVRPPVPESLRPLMALSEHERIAIFS